MFNNLKAEMVRRNITILDLAKDIHMNYRTLARKIAGRSEFTLKEMKSIKKKLNDPILTLDFLFLSN